MNSSKIIFELQKHKNLDNLQGMAKFGINTKNALGISLPYLRQVAREVGVNHNIALELWNSKIHEARILATLIEDYKSVTENQMDEWVKDFNSWDLCDQCCNNLFRRTTFAINKSFEWIENEKEFVRRAGFVLAAVLAVHNKEMSNKDFIKYFPLIEKYSIDDRNFVKKSVNWALRQIGKRNYDLNNETLKLCEKLLSLKNKTANWISRDAKRELLQKQIKMNQ